MSACIVAGIVFVLMAGKQAVQIRQLQEEEEQAVAGK